MLDELRTLFLAALFHSDTHSAIKLIDEWNDACDRIQKVFDNMTDKNPNLTEIVHAYWIDCCGPIDDFLANCSHCNYQIDTHKKHGYPKYCANCGAKMDGVPNG